MVLYSPGDQVVCRVKDNDIVNIYENKYDCEHIFDVISIYDQGWMIYIPAGMVIRSSITVNADNFQKFNIEKKFIDSEVVYVSEYRIIRTHSKLDGMFCGKCGQFHFMAAPNQTDGSLICWVCRTYKYH